MQGSRGRTGRGVTQSFMWIPSEASFLPSEGTLSIFPSHGEGHSPKWPSSIEVKEHSLQLYGCVGVRTNPSLDLSGTFTTFSDPLRVLRTRTSFIDLVGTL